MNLWTILLVVAGVTQLVGLAFFLVSSRQSPEGFQDSTGFHTGREAFVPMTAADLPETHSAEPFGHAA